MIRFVCRQRDRDRVKLTDGTVGLTLRLRGRVLDVPDRVADRYADSLADLVRAGVLVRVSSPAPEGEEPG